MPSQKRDLTRPVVSLPGEDASEEIGNMIQSYIKEIEELR